MNRIVVALKLLALFFLPISITCFAQSAVDSINRLVENTVPISKKIEILNTAAVQYKDSDLDKSFRYATEALQLATEAIDEKGIILAHLSLGRYYTKIGRHDVAMQHYVHALEHSQKIKDDRLISQTYKVMGNAYYFHNDVPASLLYYKKSLAFNLKLNDKESAADLQNNIALVFIHQKKLDSAEIFLKAAASVYDSLNLPRKLANTWLNWGELKERKKLYDEAIVLYNKALAIDRAMAIKLQEGYALVHLGSAQLALHKLSDADKSTRDALTIAEESGFESLLLNCYGTLVNISKARHDYALAFAYQEKLMVAKDSIFSREKNRQIEELRTKYESEQKDRENQELVREAKLKESQLWTTRLFLIVSIVFTVLVGLLAYFNYRSLQENRRARANLVQLNSQIQEKNEEITAQAEELIEANQQIASINENLENLVREKTSRIIQQNEKLKEYAFHNAHKVRGPLARIMGLVNLIKIDAVQKTDMPQLLGELEKASADMDKVIEEINTNLQDQTEG